MSSTIEAFDQDLQSAYKSLDRKLNGQQTPWSKNLRQAAIQKLQNLPFPTKKLEDWKYTAFERVVRQGLNPSVGSTAGKATKEDLGVFAEVPFKAVFVNGRFVQELSTLPAYAKVYQPTTIGDEYEGAFGKIASDDFYFTNLNTGFWQEALVIDVKGTQEDHLHVLHITDSTANSQFFHPRLLIKAAANAEVKLSEVYLSKGEHPAWHNSIVEADLAQDAKVHYTLVQGDQETTHHTGLTQARLQERAVFTTNTLTFSGGVIRNDINLDLLGSHTEGNMYGLYLTDGAMHVDNHTAVDHTEPNAESNELYKGIMKGKSTAVFNGKIFVRQKAQKTNAFQSNRNVLLSDSATINTKPQLEIWADDVKCSHGATTGKLDQEALFYLQSRGLSKASAQKLMLKAFSGEIIDKVASEPLRAYLEEELQKRF